MKKYKDTAYAIIVKIKNDWALYGSCVNFKDANVIFDKAEYEDKKLLNFGEVIRKREKEVNRYGGVYSINVISKDDLLNSLAKH